LAAICCNASLADLRIHGLHHSFASVLVGSGLSLSTMGALLGHARAETTASYAHLIDTTLREATGKAGQLIKSLGLIAEAPMPVDKCKEK
jgi:site-specific recombinase XerD